MKISYKVKGPIEAQVSTDATDSTELCRLFVSDCGGTGKSFLIQTVSLRLGYRQPRGKMLPTQLVMPTV